MYARGAGDGAISHLPVNLLIHAELVELLRRPERTLADVREVKKPDSRT